jgi:tape measure domain-containing protein
MAIAGTLQYDTKLDTKGIDKGVKEVSNKSKGMGDVMKIALGNIIADLASVASEGLKQIALAGVNYNATMETYQTSFRVMLGNAEKADEYLAKLKESAAKTPFELKDLAEASKTLLAFGVDADKSQEVLNRLGDVSQGNSEKLKSLALVFGQVSAQGKLTGQDFLQLVNAGFPVQKMAEDAGMSMSQFKDAISDGKITVDDLNKTLVNATSEGGMFFNSLLEQSKTFNGQLSTLKDNFATFLGEAFKPLFDYMRDTAFPILNNFLTSTDKSKFIDELFVKIIGKAPEMIKTVLDIFNKIKLTILENLPIILETGIQILLEIINGIIISIPLLIPVIIELINSLSKFITDNFPIIIRAGVDLLTSLIDGIIKTIPELIPVIIDMILLLVTTILDNIDKIVDSGIELIIALADGIIQALPELIEKIPTILISIQEAIFRNLPKIIEMGGRIIGSLITGIISAIPALISQIPILVKMMINSLGEILTLTPTIGINLIKGLWNGISDTANWLFDKVKQFASNLMASIKKAFGIASPSKLMRDLVGKNLVLGIGVGIETNTDEALKSVDYMSKELQNKMQSAVLFETGKMSVSGTAGTVNQILTAKGLQEVNVNVKAEVQEGTLFEANERISNVKNLQYAFGG